MALFEAALKKLSEVGVINLALDYQSKFDSTLAGTRNELSELKMNLRSLDQNWLFTNMSMECKKGG